MGDGTKENPFTREDVLRLIEENGGTAEGLDLSGKEFEESIDLSKLKLEGIILNRAIFPTKIQASAPILEQKGANFKEANLYEAQIQSAHLWFAQLQDALLAEANLKDADLSFANIEGTVLTRTYLQGVDLHGCKFSDGTKLGRANWGNYILGEEKKWQFSLAENTYRYLKLWYTSAGIYDISGEFFYREMTARRKALWVRKEKLKLIAGTPYEPKRTLKDFIPRKPLHWAWSMLLNILCGYGERPFRVVASALVVVLGLAATYYFWGSFSSSSFWDTLYYSAASFTALGYGQWAPQPTGWAKGMGAAEAFIGVFMIALFLVTFTRKMTR